VDWQLAIGGVCSAHQVISKLQRCGIRKKLSKYASYFQSLSFQFDPRVTCSAKVSINCTHQERTFAFELEIFYQIARRIPSFLLPPHQNPLTTKLHPPPSPTKETLHLTL
jgi:hypothetical protein